MATPIKFCPHCGEDVRLAGDPGAAAPQGAGAPSVVRREVTSKEVEGLWGLLPLPFHVIPFGVVVDGAGAPAALACADDDGKDWALAGGEVRALDAERPAAASVPDPAPAPASQPPTVPSHVCNAADCPDRRAGRGAARYGSGG